MKDPVDRIVWRKARELNPCSWNPNRVFTPELRLLERSILACGWIQPVLVSSGDVIIDGFHRWRLAQDSPALKQRYNSRVPTAVMDVDLPTAMAITVRINRAKGTHAALEMSALVHTIINDHGWAPARLAEEIGATMTEVELLLQDGVFAAKNIDKHAYSPSWYPVPAAPRTYAENEADPDEVEVDEDGEVDAADLAARG